MSNNDSDSDSDSESPQQSQAFTITENVPQEFGSGVLQHFVKDVIHGRKKWSPSSQRLIDLYGPENIKQITVFKKSLSFLLQYGTNFATLKQNDRLYHLGCMIITDKHSFLLEKNEQPVLKMSSTIPQNDEILHISSFRNQSLKALLETTADRVGANFWRYNALTANCQMFIIEILKTLSADNETNRNFVLQDLSSIKQNINPIIRKIANTATDVASAVLTGNGRSLPY